MNFSLVCVCVCFFFMFLYMILEKGFCWITGLIYVRHFYTLILLSAVLIPDQLPHFPFVKANHTPLSTSTTESMKLKDHIKGSWIKMVWIKILDSFWERKNKMKTAHKKTFPITIVTKFFSLFSFPWKKKPKYHSFFQETIKHYFNHQRMSAVFCLSMFCQG